MPVAREGSVDEDLLEDSSNRIEEYFRAQGYRDAAAPHTREQTNGELVITFTVHKGGQYRVEAIDIAGNAAIAARRSLLASCACARASRSRRRRSTRTWRRSRTLYRRLGFASARVPRSRVEPRPAGGRSARPVAIRIQVTENLQTVVNSVRVEGNASVPEDELTAVMGLAPGQPFFVSAGWRSIATPFSCSTRTSDTRAPRLRRDPGLSADGTRADVVFVVREGPRVFVDHVLIVGNERTQDGRPSSASCGSRRAIRSGSRRSARASAGSRRSVCSGGARITAARTRRRDPPRRAGHGRGSAAHDRRLRRRLRSAVAHRPIGRGSDCRVGEVRVRTARLVRDRPAQPVRQQSIGEPVHEHQPSPARFTSVRQPGSRGRRAGGWGFPEYRVVGTVPRAAGIRIQCRLPRLPGRWSSRYAPASISRGKA